jgi:hypothetical protein
MMAMIATVKITTRGATTAETMIPIGDLSGWDVECAVAAGVIVIRTVEKVEGGVVVVDSETDVDVLPEIGVDVEVEVDVDPPDEAVSLSRLQTSL